MQLTVEAWKLREAARSALADGDFAGACRFAERAQRSQFTGEGEALRLLIAWLGETEGLREER